MTRLTSDALAAIRARADAATPGPWKFSDDGTIGGVVGHLPEGRPFRFDNAKDGRFVCAARTDIPALLAHIATIDGQLKAMTDAALLAFRERDALAAKLAEAERERDEAWAKRRLYFHEREVQKREDAALAEQRRLAAEVTRLLGVVDAKERELSTVCLERPLTITLQTVERERATLAAEVERMRALPNEEPPPGWLERLTAKWKARRTATAAPRDGGESDGAPWVPRGRLSDEDLAHLYSTSKDETTIALAEELLVLRARVAEPK